MNKLFQMKRWHVIILVIVILLAIFNPTLKDFDEYAGPGGNKRTGYFLIGSTFTEIVNYRKKVYLGIFKNFIYIKTFPGYFY